MGCTPAGACSAAANARPRAPAAGLAFLGCDYAVGCRAWIGGKDWHERQAIVHEVGQAQHGLFGRHGGQR